MRSRKLDLAGLTLRQSAVADRQSPDVVVLLTRSISPGGGQILRRAIQFGCGYFGTTANGM
jgi:hypothetical protein